MYSFASSSITQANRRRWSGRFLSVCLLIIGILAGHSALADDSELERFKRAWDAAKHGDHDSFRQISDTLNDYVLFPYLQYEDYRNRRSNVPADEMAAFLEAHQGWAFTTGLRNAWLNALAKKGRWVDLLRYSDGITDTVLRCQRARGRIILKQTDDGRCLDPNREGRAIH